MVAMRGDHDDESEPDIRRMAGRERRTAPRAAAAATRHGFSGGEEKATEQSTRRAMTEPAPPQRPAVALRWTRVGAGVELRWCWRGAGVELRWSWRGAGVELAWSCGGAVVELAWSYGGAGVELPWSCGGAGVELAWSWALGAKRGEDHSPRTRPRECNYLELKLRSLRTLWRENADRGGVLRAILEATARPSGGGDGLSASPSAQGSFSIVPPNKAETLG
ncbi:unnamed protein product [Lampetra fluviatilis]